MKTRKGTESDDVIEGSKAAEKIYGLGGNDAITGGGGDDKIWCGNNVGSENDQWDKADGGAGSDLIYGEDGIDFLHGGAGADRLFGGNDDDFLFGDGGKDALHGDAGDDIIIGGIGKDMLYGGLGNDSLDAISGNDVMDGGEGNDLYFTGEGKVNTIDKSGSDKYFILEPDAFASITDRTGKDTLVFNNFVKDDLMFTRQGFDLLIEIDGFRGETTLSGFYLNKNNRIETLMDSSDNDKGYDLSVLKMLKFDSADVNGEDLWL